MNQMIITRTYRPKHKKGKIIIEFICGKHIGCNYCKKSYKSPSIYCCRLRPICIPILEELLKTRELTPGEGICPSKYYLGYQK